MVKREPSYYDEKGREIKEFGLLKIFHFIGARRKKHYMYKHIGLVEFEGKLSWVAYHLDGSGDYYHLRTYLTDYPDRKIHGAVLVQQGSEDL